MNSNTRGTYECSTRKRNGVWSTLHWKEAQGFHLQGFIQARVREAAVHLEDVAREGSAAGIVARAERTDLRGFSRSGSGHLNL